MLAATDKLHKLYSMTAEPVVWARSVGLEVLNELDTIKAALMMSAGSERSTKTGEVGWELAARSVESFARNIDGVRHLGSKIKDLLAAGLRDLSQRR